MCKLFKSSDDWMIDYIVHQKVNGEKTNAEENLLLSIGDNKKCVFEKSVCRLMWLKTSNI